MTTEWIKNRRPTAEDADRDGQIRLLCKNGNYTLVDFELIASGAPWQHSQRWHEDHPSHKVLSGWINDCLPQEWDADIDGDVLVQADDDEGDIFVHWTAVCPGQTWRHGQPAVKGIIESLFTVPAPVPLCVRLPEGNDLDAEGRCSYGFWERNDGGGRWHWSYQDQPLEQDTHWCPHWAKALPETAYKPADIG